MNLTSLLKNKFIIAIPLSIILLGCLFKFNEYKDITNEKEGKPLEKKDMKYYFKFFLIFYLVSITLIILLMKGYDKLTNKLAPNSSIENIKMSENKEPLPSSDVIKDSLISNTKNEYLSAQKPNPVEERNNQLNNDIQELNVDVDTSDLTDVNLLNTDLNKQKSDIIQKQNLINKRKKLLELKNKRMNKRVVESINTGTPNF